AVGGSAPAGATALDDLADVALDAGGIDAFYASDLDLVLRTRGVRRLVLAGVGLETCVHSTMRDANDRGYECLLVVDACVPVAPDLVGAAVSSVEMSGGIFGAVGRTAAVVTSLTTRPVSPVPTSGALS
ncbi:cysteine hydrolase family protein, partial [Cellulomonas septica]